MTSDELLNKIITIQKEQLRWDRLSGMNHLKGIFDVEFKNDDEKIIYELSDGEKSTRDLEKDVGVSRSKIALLWHKWYNMGIMEKSQKYDGKRMKRSFSMADVGMYVKMPSKYSHKQKSEEVLE